MRRLPVRACRSAGIAALIVAAPQAAQSAPQSHALVAGDYGGGLLLGVDPATRMVSGYFQSQTGGGQFSCIFYLAGRLNGRAASVRTYFPETPGAVIAGQLTIQSARQVRLRLREDHGGCWNVQQFVDPTQPADFTVQTAHPWISIAVVRRQKVYFFDTAGAPTHREAYVVQGDGVGVRARRPGWLRVDFVGARKLMTGWIRQSDVYPAP